jgi:Nucleotide modification associated domain 3
MKVILSRKGFDSEWGGMPSPIMPDGTLLSLPIPSPDGDTEKFSTLKYKGKTYKDIIYELKPKNGITAYCHLDPDLRESVINRQKNWLPLFGQSSAAQSHLENKCVKYGDLFLFFGWFKETELIDEKLRYKKGAPHQHIIWGYLEIGEIYNIQQTANILDLPEWTRYHSHSQKHRLKEPHNRIYRATKELSFAPSYTGGGVFKFHKDLILTKEGYKKGQWKLPEFFKKDKIDISYHTEVSHKRDYFQSTAKGQEFVIEDNKNVSTWAKKLVKQSLKLK